MSREGVMPFPEEMRETHQALRRKYHKDRRVWAWRIGRPYSQDIDKPPPGVFDLPAHEDG